MNRLDRVVPIRQALWIEDTDLAPNRDFRDGQAWSFSLKRAEGAGTGTIPATTLRSLLDRQGWNRVDLLKIDIEGGEAPLVRDPDTLAVIAERVTVLCMEVHPEAISREEVRQALTSLGMSVAPSGETLIAWHPPK